MSQCPPVPPKETKEYKFYHNKLTIPADFQFAQFESIPGGYSNLSYSYGLTQRGRDSQRDTSGMEAYNNHHSLDLDVNRMFDQYLYKVRKVFG